MLTFLSDNAGTLIVAAALLAVIVTVAVKMIKDKKKGKGACGCGCSNCAMSALCHSNGDITAKHTQKRLKNTRK